MHRIWGGRPRSRVDHAQEFPLLPVEDLTSSAQTPESGAIDEVQIPSSGSNPAHNIHDQSIPEFHKNLKLVALSKDHQMTHLPKNRYCVGCIRTKMNAKPARKRSVKSEAKKFGDIVTADHLIPREGDYEGKGIDVHRVALVIKDHFSNWVDIYPAGGKSADSAEMAIKSFQGTRKCKQLN